MLRFTRHTQSLPGSDASFRLDGRTRRRRPWELKPQIEQLDSLCLMSGDMVLGWNSVALQAVANDHSGGVSSQAGPTRTARALAIVHVAISDAVSNIDRSY